jgi:predicted deacetylase
MNFFSPKYLIRLDDASHYSNYDKWHLIEKILIKYNVKPIVAVTPKNMDKNIQYSGYNDKFWEKVHKWEKLNWTIAMHGYNHVYHYCKRFKLKFPFYNRSEFGGLSLKEQTQKIKKANEIFLSNGIKPKIWVAPSHSFDLLTLKAIEKVTDIRIISDGIAFSSFFENGFNYIPQQLWDFKNKFFGTWTICLHPDTISENELKDLELFLKNKSIKSQMTEFKKIHLKKRGLNFFEKMYSTYFWTKYNFKYTIKSFLKF